MSTFSEIGKLLKSKMDPSVRTLEITSKEALTPEQIEELRTSIGEDLIIKHTINTQLTGGISIKLGDLLFDADIDRNIDALEDHLKRLEPADNIIDGLSKGLEGYHKVANVAEVGTILSVKDGICYIEGLTKCMAQEVLELSGGTKAIALNLEENRIGAVILGDFRHIKAGDLAKRSYKVAEVAVGEDFLGRVINPLSQAIDGRPEAKPSKFYPIERVAPGVMTRQPVEKPLHTGITAIDALVPIGRGQRELILGDRQTGKTALAIDTIINQKGKGVICIYVSIGQKDSKLSRIVNTLKQHSALDYTIVVSAGAADSATMQYIAPYSGTAMAEYFADQGKDVLVIYDDLTKHAIAYRELSLLLRRPPGREAYPGDVFYLHSRLLERACSLNSQNGGGTITALPIIETQAGDISAYIPTNVISITDGQIFLEADLFYRGIRPAINVGLSVSRVGGAAQTKPLRKVSGSVKLALAQYREMESFAQFAGELDKSTKQLLDRGRRIIELLKQPVLQPRTDLEQVVLIYAITQGLLDDIPLTDLNSHLKALAAYVSKHGAKIVKAIESNQWDEKIAAQLTSLCEDYLKIHVSAKAD